MKITKKSLLGLLILCMLFTMVGPLATVAKADTVAPDFTIKRAMGSMEYKDGDTGTITYTVTPIGSIDAPQERPAADVTLILDLSGSMNDKSVLKYNYEWRLMWYGWIQVKVPVYGPTKLDVLKQSAKAFVQNIKSANTNRKTKDRISIVCFDMYPKQTKAFTVNYDSLLSHIDTLTASGWTNYEDAMIKADTDFKKSTAKSKFAVLFSDGEPTHYHGFTDDRYSDERRAALYSVSRAKILSKNNITLYTIGMGTDEQINMPLLQDIATAGGGKAYQASEASQMDALFTAVSSEITSICFSEIRIVDSMPAGITVLESPRTTVNADNTFETQMDNIVFLPGQGTPPPITATVNVRFDKSGSFELKNGIVKYKLIDGSMGTKPIDKITVNVYDSVPVAPTLQKNPTTLTNKDVLVTVSYPASAAVKLYRTVTDGVSSDFLPYPAGGIVVPKNCTVYACYDDSQKKRSKEGSIVVDNIDKTAPVKPVITSDRAAGSVSKDPVKITITYPSDATEKLYRLNGKDPWIAYTGPITVTDNGTLIEAMGKDSLGNVSEIADYTVTNITLMTSVDFKFDGGKFETSVMRKGLLTANLVFKTTGRGIPEFVLIPEAGSEDFFRSMAVTSTTLKDSDGNTYTVKQTADEITVTCNSAIDTNGKELTLKMSFDISGTAPFSTTTNFYTLMLKDNPSSKVKIRVVRNPKLY